MENMSNDQSAVTQAVDEESKRISVPQSLSPENVKKRLIQKKRKMMRRFAEVAAAVVLVVVLSSTGVSHRIANSTNGNPEKTTQVDTDTNMSLIGDVSHSQKIGKYHQAKDYKEVCNLIKENQRNAEAEDSDNSLWNKDEPSNITDVITPEAKQNRLESITDDFSKTNTMFEGIDESDFVKNDFDNLFVQDNEKVSIIDISSDKMKLVTTIAPELEESDTICEMYADTEENRIVLIIQRLIDCEAQKNLKDTGTERSDGLIEQVGAQVIMQTYDITDRAKPELVGTVTMDGRYKDSRKNGQQIVLFTTKAFHSLSNFDEEELIPKINGEKMKSDCIYLGECVRSELITASVSLSDPEKTIDQMAIMSGFANIYMSDSAIYLYEENYKDGSRYTEITRFHFHSGYLGQGRSVTVQGAITDRFAISEGENGVRVLTTIGDGKESTNELHLYNFGMEEEGSVTGIAKGEEIYAARYIGNIAYFVTYRNTDPLFAVDISDCKNPKMLGNVKMTGYSDYLHPYGDNLLLGIGFETDPETSQKLGVKLTMFDTSDPVNLKILDHVVIKDADTQATYDYKAILADARKNLIGLSVEHRDTPGEKMALDYLVYRWENGHFVKTMTEEIGADDVTMSQKVRGVYAGMHFYCIYPKGQTYQVTSYDMEENFKTLDMLKL